MEDKLPLLCIEPNFKSLAKDICDRYPQHINETKLLLKMVMQEGRGTINPELMLNALLNEINVRNQNGS